MKLDPESYWGQGDTVNLRWFLGMQPSGQLPAGYAGHLLGFGWQSANYRYGLPDFYPVDYPYFNYNYGVHYSVEQSGGMSVTDLINTDTPRKPAYDLLPTNGVIPFDNPFFDDQIQVIPQGLNPLIGSQGNAYSRLATGCASRTSSPVQYTWQVEWSNTTVSTKGYSGPALKARYTETAVSGPQAGFVWLEEWYYAYGIGPVRIDGSYGHPPLGPLTTELELVSYVPGTGAPVVPFVTMRDALLAQSTSGDNTYTFQGWRTLFSQVTNMVAPTYAAACGNPFGENSLITVDSFLASLEYVGQSCSTVQYPNEANGWTANFLIQQMQNYLPPPMAGSSYGQWNFGYGYDQWNYAYNQVRQANAPFAQAVCMKTVLVPDWNPTITVVPNEWMLLTPRQWLLYYHNQSNGGCAS